MSVELANYLDPHSLYTEGNLVLLDLNAPHSSTSGLDFTRGEKKKHGVIKVITKREEACAGSLMHTITVWEDLNLQSTSQEHSRRAEMFSLLRTSFPSLYHLEFI